jgi:hypothetical protein
LAVTCAENPDVGRARQDSANHDAHRDGRRPLRDGGTLVPLDRQLGCLHCPCDEGRSGYGARTYNNMIARNHSAICLVVGGLSAILFAACQERTAITPTALSVTEAISPTNAGEREPAAGVWSPYPAPVASPEVSVLSLDQAVARTLADVDPLAHPTVSAAIAVALPSEAPLRQALESTFFGDNCDGAHLVVAIRYMAAARALDYLYYEAATSGTPTPNPDFRDVPEELLEVYCAATGEVMASLPGDPEAPGWVTSGTGSTPVPIVTATPGPVGTTAIPTSVPTVTAGPTEPPLPIGRPIAPAELPPAIRHALLAFPLLPGNSWTYLVRDYIHGLSSRRLVTETVQSMVLLAGGRLLITATVDQDAPAGFGALDYDYGITWPMVYGESRPEHIYWLVVGGDFYRLMSPAEVVRKLASVEARTPPAMPGAMPDDTHWLRWPVAVGDTWSHAPDHELESLPYECWRVAAEAQVDVPGGRFGRCLLVAFEETFGGLHCWFCPGVGFVRVQGSSWAHTPDLGYTVADLAVSRLAHRIER